MADTIPAHHPLRELFAALTEKCFSQNFRWSDGSVVRYLGNLLAEFTHVDQLYRILNSKDERLEDVASMLAESDLLLNAGSFEREREVHRHIGDFTLFMSGIFPEFLRRLRVKRFVHHPDFLIDYVRVGKRSYRNVSEFNYGEFRESVPLFRKLSDNFELCVVGLAYVRTCLDRLPNPEFQRAKSRWLT